MTVNNARGDRAGGGPTAGWREQLARRLEAFISSPVPPPDPLGDILSAVEYHLEQATGSPDTADLNWRAALINSSERWRSAVEGRLGPRAATDDRFERAFRSSPLAILITRVSDGRIVELNDAFCGLSGYGRDECLSSNTIALGLWADPEERIAVLSELTTHRHVGPRETQFLSRSGSPIAAYYHGELMDFSGVPHVLSTVEDLTLAKQKEQERSHLQAQLARSQKLESVGRLAAGVAHDFNNVLSAILNCAEVLLTSAEVAAPDREVIEDIVGAVTRGTGLTRQLLSFSRRSESSPTVLDLNQVLRDIRRMLSHMIGEDVSIVFELGSELWKVTADISHMEQVILNLAVNARDAMPKGGTLSFSTRNLTVLPQGGENRGLVPGEYIVLSISDTGHGMGEDTLAQIFEPFFTTKEAGTGTGLGLSTVREVLKQSGGQVQVRSQVGQGTTFDVFLPRCDGSPVSVPEVPRSLDIPGSGETVLVVEDEEVMLATTCRILRSAGYEVLSARQGEEALALVEKLEGKVGLVLTDAIMPSMSGAVMIALLRARYPAIRFVVMSGYAVEHLQGQSMLAPDVAFVSKPFTAASLRHAIKGALMSRPPSRGPILSR